MGVFWNRDVEVEGKTKTELCIECESIIQDEKKEYGRVSKMTMRFLREKYGDDRANRAMYRQQKKKNIKSRTDSMIELGLNALAKWTAKKTNFETL